VPPVSSVVPLAPYACMASFLWAKDSTAQTPHQCN
jgi:hypothetical protein